MTPQPDKGGELTAYRRMANSVRLMRRDVPYAHELQRRGKTLSEIADYFGVPVKAVHQSLYWDKMQ